MHSLKWRHNERDCVSNYRYLDCLLNRLFRHRSKKTSEPCVTGLCEGNHRWPVDFPHKGPVTWKMFPFDVVFMFSQENACENVLFQVAAISLGLNAFKSVCCFGNLSLAVRWWWYNPGTLSCCHVSATHLPIPGTCRFYLSLIDVRKKDSRISHVHFPTTGSNKTVNKAIPFG